MKDILETFAIPVDVYNAAAIAPEFESLLIHILNAVRDTWFGSQQPEDIRRYFKTRVRKIQNPDSRTRMCVVELDVSQTTIPKLKSYTGAYIEIQGEVIWFEEWVSKHRELFQSKREPQRVLEYYMALRDMLAETPEDVGRLGTIFKNIFVAEFNEDV